MRNPNTKFNPNIFSYFRDYTRMKTDRYKILGFRRDEYYRERKRNFRDPLIGSRDLALKVYQSSILQCNSPSRTSAFPPIQKAHNPAI
jgi:hypothetical protein